MTGWLALLLVLPLPAGAQPPVFPQASENCVAESTVVADTVSWAQGRTAAKDVWPLTRGAGVVVAVLDTGVNAAAGGLSGGVVRTGADVVAGGPGDRDCLGRGTALAGIVASRPVSGSAFVGVAPEAAVLPVRLADGKGKIPPGAIAKGLRAATAAGADVILLGVGTPTPDADLRAAVAAAVARDIVVVAPVSDQKPQQGAPSAAAWYPAADDRVLAVGGIGPDGTMKEKAGPAAGLDLLAPGAGAVSIGPTGRGHYTVSGPAVAAAHVAGAAALLRAYRPELDQAQVRRRLELTAEHPRGILDLYAALTDVATYAPAAPENGARSIALPPVPRPDPAWPIAGAVAAGVVATAVLAYVSALAIRWGRRRRWRP